MPPIRLKFRREIIWPLLLAGTITWCSGYPATVPEVKWFEPDKVGHFAAYGALATAIIRHPAILRRGAFAPWFALLVASAYGMGDEFRQSLTGGIRTFDMADWVADTAGASVAAHWYAWWPGYRRLLERPVFRREPRVEIAPESLPNSSS